MLTPPYDFAIVAAPINAGGVGSGEAGPGRGSGSRSGSSSSNATGVSGLSKDTAPEAQILYRGSLPAARNAPFVRRLGIRTLVCLRKKPLDDEDPLRRWAERRGMDVRWFKAEKMGEESLGMERAGVSEVLQDWGSQQILLTPSAYPIYLADVDGNSHTTLIVACLRKLQGWDAESIEQEIYRFEPDHDDLPLVPFITSYLSTNQVSKDEPGAALVLPPPPYPPWLWPVVPASSPTSVPLRSTGTQATTRSERATSSASISSTTSTTSLPFPNPLTARRHPSMRLTFPNLPPPPAGSAAPKVAAQRTPSMGPLSRINTVERGAHPASPRDELSERSGAGTGNGPSTVTSPQTSSDGTSPAPPGASGASASTPRLPPLHRVSFHDPTTTSGGILTRSPVTYVGRGPYDSILASPEKDLSALDDGEEEDGSDGMDEEGDVDEYADAPCGSEAEFGDEEEEEEDDEDEEAEDEEEEEEEEEEEDQEVVSQYISALDLAGYG